MAAREMETAPAGTDRQRWLALVVLVRGDADDRARRHGRERRAAVDPAGPLLLTVEPRLVVNAHDAAGYLQLVGPQLDPDFSELKRQAESARFWRLAQERFPVAAGVGVAAGFELMAAGQPLLAGAALVQGTVAQGLQFGLETLRRARGVRHHPLYWRFRLPGLTSPA